MLSKSGIEVQKDGRGDSWRERVVRQGIEEEATVHKRTG